MLGAWRVFWSGPAVARGRRRQKDPAPGLNKLKGTHDKLLDAEEFKRIQEADGKDDLKALLGISDGTLERYDKLLDAAGDERGAILDSTFEVVVKCKDEEEQKRVFDDLKSQGLDVRILTL